MYKMAIVYRDLSPVGGFPCNAFIFEPGAGLTELRNYDNFSDAYVALDAEGWEPMHGEFDPTTYLPCASFRMKVEKKLQKAKSADLQLKMQKKSAKSDFARKGIEAVMSAKKK